MVRCVNGKLWSVFKECDESHSINTMDSLRKECGDVVNEFAQLEVREGKIRNIDK